MVHSLLLLFLLSGCTAVPDPDPGDPQRYAAALAALQTDPTRAGVACGTIRSPDLRGDCLCAGAEALASADDQAAAEGICAQIPAGLSRDECWFVVAEKSTAPDLCAQAGRFMDDCRLHLLQQAAAQSPDLLRDAPALLQRAGFADADPRPWTLIYRHALGKSRTLDLGLCDQAGEPEARTWCRRAGLGLLHDRLNYVRDARVPEKAAWCAGAGPLPSILAHTDDPEIDAAIAERTDVCGR